MDPYYSNFTPVSQASEDEYPGTSTSIVQDSRIPSLLPSPVTERLPTASQKSYSVPGHNGRGSSQAPQMPGTNLAQSFYTPMEGGFIKTFSSPSSHPYHQARLYHMRDRASAQHQGRSQLPFSTVSTPASCRATPHNAVTGHCASTRSHESRQLYPVARKIAPAIPFGSLHQSDIVASNTKQIVPSFTASLTVPRQTFPSTYETPAPVSYTPFDEGDIEYAQYRYGNNRCFYQCRFDLSGSPCNKWIVGDRVRVLRHLRSHHHLQIGPATPVFCRWDKCTHPRPMKQENLSRHVVMHLGVKWKCPHCRRLFSRDDAVHRHIERMVPGMNVPDAEVIPGWEARAINESQSERAQIA